MRLSALLLLATVVGACGAGSDAGQRLPAQGGGGAGSDGGSNGGLDAGTVSGTGAGLPDGGAGPGAGDGGSLGGGGSGSDGGGTVATGGGADGGSTSGGDVPAAPVRLTTGEHAVDIAIDGTNVYWTVSAPDAQNNAENPVSYDLRSVAKAGGDVRVLVHRFGAAGLPASDGATLFYPYSGCGGGDCYGSTIATYPAASGWNPDGWSAVAVDSTSVYSIDVPRPTVGDTQELERISKQSGTATILATVDGSPSTTALDVYAGTVYWAYLRSGAAHLDAVSADGGSVAHLAQPGAARIARVKADDHNVFFRAGLDVMRVSPSGGDAQVLWHAASEGDLDANASIVYWTQSPSDAGSTHYAGCLGRANADGTQGRCLDQAEAIFGGVRVDDSNIYYVKDGDIYRLAK